MVHLPIELWERVIDFLAFDDIYSHTHSGNAVYKNLITCALTCRSWKFRCRFHLLYDRKLSGPHHVKSTVSMLREEPADTPLTCHFKRLLVNPSCADGVGPPPSSWVSCIPVRLTKYMILLDKLHLSGIDLQTMHPSFISALSFSKSVTQLVLTECKFLTITILVRLVQSFPRLASLVLKSLQVQPEQSWPVGYRIKASTLQTLVIGSLPPSAYCPIITWLSSTASKLVSVHLEPCWCTTAETAGLTRKLLSECESLQELSVEVVSELPDALDYIVIHQLNALQNFDVWFKTGQEPSKQKKALPNLLQRMSSSPALTQILVLLSADDEKELDALPWEEIEEAFIGEGFKGLQFLIFLVIRDDEELLKLQEANSNLRLFESQSIENFELRAPLLWERLQLEMGWEKRF